MFRKFVIAAAAIAALGTVSLTASTTPAAAWHKGWRASSSTAATCAVYTGVYASAMTRACAAAGS